MTPHIKARLSDIAKIVIMPGDPLRARWIAENFLSNFKLVNDVRGMFAFTGTYKGKKITVMGHGMGIPSIGIYTYELFKFYKVKTIIRVGSCGSYDESINVGDVVVASEAYSKSTYAIDIGLKNPGKVLSPSQNLLKITTQIVKKNKINTHFCRVNSEDTFYNAYSLPKIKSTTGAKAVEMEAFALYANAKIFKKDALTLLTCSDSLVTKKSMSPAERQTTFTKMINLAFLIFEKI